LMTRTLGTPPRTCLLATNRSAQEVRARWRDEFEAVVLEFHKLHIEELRERLGESE
jgi:hypothetical protein